MELYYRFRSALLSLVAAEASIMQESTTCKEDLLWLIERHGFEIVVADRALGGQLA